MATKSSSTDFEPLAGVPSILVACKGKLRMFAFTLRSGDVCLFSPVKGLAEKVRDSLAALGPVRFLLAPNHFHNQGLQEFLEVYRDAQLVASEEAIPRLEKVTGLSFTPLDALNADLPDTMSLLGTEGLKTGEVWLQARSGPKLAWIVVDAFCGADVYGPVDGPDLLKTFKTYGLEDKDRYVSWLQTQLASAAPDILAPCHGSAVQCPDLAGKLTALVANRL
ncbi:MAG: hypothetical protein AAGF86_16005 [Pseudomonadota bacterium]